MSAACECTRFEEDSLPAEAARTRLHHRALERRRVVHARRAEAHRVVHGVEQPERPLCGAELDGHEGRCEAARGVLQRCNRCGDEGKPLLGAQRPRGDGVRAEEEACSTRPHRTEPRPVQDASGEAADGDVLDWGMDAVLRDQCTQFRVQMAHLCVCGRMMIRIKCVMNSVWG